MSKLPTLLMREIRIRHPQIALQMLDYDCPQKMIPADFISNLISEYPHQMVHQLDHQQVPIWYNTNLVFPPKAIHSSSLVVALAEVAVVSDPALIAIVLTCIPFAHLFLESVNVNAKITYLAPQRNQTMHQDNTHNLMCCPRIRANSDMQEDTVQSSNDMV